MPRHKNQNKGSAAAHPNSIEGRAQVTGDKSLMKVINRKRREADIDLALLNKWNRTGFVSGVSSMAPADEDNDEGEQQNED